MNRLSILDLPNEIVQHCLFYLSSIEVFNAAKVLPKVCGFNFWMTKAKDDFGVSTHYFKLPSQQPGGFGTFGEISQHLDSNSRSVNLLGPGAFRYLQIATRFSLSIGQQANSIEQLSDHGLLEAPMFFFEADRRNETELLGSFLNYPAVMTVYIRNVFQPLEKIYSSGIPFNHQIVHSRFRYLLSRRIFTSNFLPNSARRSEEEFIEPVQILQGESVKKISDFLLSEVAVPPFQIVQMTCILLKNSRKYFQPFALDLLEKILQVGDKVNNAKLLSFAIMSGNMDLIARIQNYGDYLNAIDPVTGQHLSGVWQFINASYFSGNFEVIKLVNKDRTQIAYKNVESFVNGYRFHRQPEEFLECLTQFSSKLSEKQVSLLCSLGDCDIIAHLLQESISFASRDYILTTIQFLEDNFSSFVGYLDVVAWARRIIDKNSPWNDLTKYKLEVENGVELKGEERLVAELKTRCHLSLRMFKKRRRSQRAKSTWFWKLS